MYKTYILSYLGLEMKSLKKCYKIANESRTPKLARHDEREFLSINSNLKLWRLKKRANMHAKLIN